MGTDKNKIFFRKASERDINTLVDYRITFLKDAYGEPVPELESFLRLNLKHYFSESFKNKTYISWIAEYDNKPVGFSGMVIREQPANFEAPNGRTGYILNIFTLPGFRGNGIASSLVQKLIEEARQMKIDKVELHATKVGEPVYRKLGFVEPHDKALEIIIK
jgi:ribosomal protein S18 acetylase RimI-like enzyme